MPTGFTFVRLVTSVHSLVYLQSARGCIGLCAIGDRALVWPLALVTPHVVGKTVGLTERFRAEFTSVRPFTRMYAHVNIEIADAAKGLGTNLARTWRLVGMASGMRVVGVFASELLAAVRT